MRKRTYIGLAAATLLLTTLQSSAFPAPADRFLTETDLQSEDPLFGGISAIDISDDGLRLLAISDVGAFAQGVIVRDAEDKIVSVSFEPVEPLKTFEGSRYTGTKDTEGVAVGADGKIYVSYELYTYVTAFSQINGFPVKLPSPPEFEDYMNNGSLEALAIDRVGTLYAVPEVPATRGADFPVFRFDGAKWDHELTLQRRDGYMAVSADFGPDGRFYLMERLYYGFPAFSTRLRRFDLTKLGFENEETLFTTTIGAHENLEGLSVWRNLAGGLVATMMADDNFNALFSTQLVEYSLPD